MCGVGRGYEIWDMGYQMRLWVRWKEEGGRRTLLLRARILVRWVRRDGGEVLRYKNNGRQGRGVGDKCGYEGPIGFGWRESEGHWDKFVFCDFYAVLYFYGQHWTYNWSIDSHKSVHDVSGLFCTGDEYEGSWI